MGAQPSCFSILAQDYDFGDIFAKFELQDTSLIHYIVGDKNKLKGQQFNSKKQLIETIGGHPLNEIPSLFTNGKGLCDEIDMDFFTERVKKDLSPIIESIDAKLQLLLTGQCAPLVKIINKLLDDEYFSLTKIEVFIVFNAHNSIGLFEELLNLHKLSQTLSITLSIQVFTSNTATEENAEVCDEYTNFTNCTTSENFSSEVVQMADDNNKLAKAVVQYASENKMKLSEIPIDKLAICLLYNNDSSLFSFDVLATQVDNRMKICGLADDCSTKNNETQYLKILHCVSAVPETTIKDMEEIILRIIREH